MTRKIYLLYLFISFSTILFGQQKRNGHLPAARTKAEYQLMIDNNKNVKTTLGKATVWPSNMRMPGEFEESKAICISWAYEYNEDFSAIIGIDTNSVYGWISAQLAHYISQECEVWIRVWEANDTLKVKQFMGSLGWPLNNYKFFVKQGDDFWMRDFGPIGFYYGTKDSVGFTDMKYYDGRELDNVFPSYLASQMNYKNYPTALNAEGGNLMTDGYGRMFFSSKIKAANNDILRWSNTTTYTNMKTAFATNDLQELTVLNCDGGTGHIDLYTKLIDEETILVSKLPAEITANDRQIIEDNYQKMAALKSTYNRPYTIYRIPHPTGDEGKYDSVTCDQLFNDARNFVNGITVNNTFLFPAYSDEIDGNKEQTDSIVKLFQSIMPGYNVVPIDCRSMSPLGGAIHCITMQVPADNPIRIWHPKVQANKTLQTDFRIIAKCENYSGIKEVACVWRKNNGAWKTLTLTDSATYSIGILSIPDLTATDLVEYYIAAESNNGKKVTKPATATVYNQGYYRIQFSYGTNIEAIKVEPKNYLFAAFPNPAANQLNVPFQLLNNAQVNIQVLDITGKIWVEKQVKSAMGLQTEILDINNLPSGLYFYNLSIDGQMINTRKFLKQ
ncbi:MAG: agmatine deiminase family protein [Bacteroidota bacterium]